MWLTCPQGRASTRQKRRHILAEQAGSVCEAVRSRGLVRLFLQPASTCWQQFHFQTNCRTSPIHSLLCVDLSWRVCVVSRHFHSSLSTSSSRSSRSRGLPPRDRDSRPQAAPSELGPIWYIGRGGVLGLRFALPGPPCRQPGGPFQGGAPCQQSLVRKCAVSCLERTSVRKHRVAVCLFAIVRRLCMALFAPHAHFESLHHPGMQHLCTLRHRFTDHKTKTRERSTSEASIAPLECVWVTYAIFKSKPL